MAEKGDRIAGRLREDRSAAPRQGPDTPATGPAPRWYPGGELGQVSDQQDKQPLPEDAALRAIVEGVESETGDRFFASLVQHLASALGAQYAFVSELSDDRKRFRTRALWGRGAFLPNIFVPVAGTPCEGVLNGQMSHFPERLQEVRHLPVQDRKSTRLNSSHRTISYAVFCLKKKKKI